MNSEKKLNNLDKLSKGCKLCQQGRWLCIYLTYKCNADCHFCPAPLKNDQIKSAFGNKKEEILEYLLANDFEGISFSGGDPFLVYDRLLDWLNFFKKHRPKYYYWVYTNGLAVTENKLEELAKSGMDEIRFNIAASGYLSNPVWENIRAARKLFSYVSIEIPSIKKDFNYLLKALELMEMSGIDFLNMHDYIKSQTDPGFESEITGCFQLNKTIPLEFAISSRENTQTIIRLVENTFSFRVNPCSMEQKEQQMLLRRLKMGSIFNDPKYDSMNEEGIVYNYYRLPGKIDINKFKEILTDPGTRKQMRNYQMAPHNIIKTQSGNTKLLRVSYIPKMEIDLDKVLIEVTAIWN